MGLVCLENTIISDKNESLELKAGDKIHVENSHKFNNELVNKIALESDLSVKNIWFSTGKYYMLIRLTK